MKTTEVNKELIGRRCECIFTGLMVTGVIEDTEENEHTKEVKVRFDRPHQWAMICITMFGRGGARLTSSARCATCNCWRASRILLIISK